MVSTLSDGALFIKAERRVFKYFTKWTSKTEKKNDVVIKKTVLNGIDIRSKIKK